MKKLLLPLLLCPNLLLATEPPPPTFYNPANPPQIVLLTKPAAPLEPTPVIGPAAIIVGVGVGVGIIWGGFKIAHKIMDLWEFKLTNTPPAEVVFTFDGEESGQ